MQLTLTVSKQTSLLHQLAFDTMAAFNFPDPTIQQTVTNPITGSTYQWKEPPGKWVITTKVRAVSDIIYEGDSPPAPRGDFKLWYSTDSLELYFWYEDINGNGAWVPTAAPITMLEDLDEGLFEVRQLLNQVNSAAITNENDIILIRESLGKVNLQEVLDNGNTANKGAEFGGSVTTAGISNQGNATFKFGSGQGIVIDSGSSYEQMLALRSYSGPNQRKDVLKVGAGGNAELLGKLKLAPGEADNEAVTYGQLATVAEEIEQVVPAYERGKYNFSLTDVSTGTGDRGKYTLLRLNTASDNSAATKECEDARNTCNRIPDKDPIDCEIEYNSCIARLPAPGTVDIVTNSFNSVQKIKFSKYDADGAKHEWTDVAVGQVIDIFNDGDDNYFVGEITAIDNTNANLVLLTVNKVQAKGNAVGAARIKVFTLNNEIDELTNYVRKTGDQMTGTLETTGRILIRPDDVGAKGNNNMLVVNQQSSKGQASIARFQQDGDDIIKVQYDRTTTFNHNRITEVGDPTDGEDAVNMQWVENYVAANVRRLWKWTGDQTSTPGEGKFSWAQSGAGYCYFDHRPFIGSELYCSGNQYFCKGGNSLSDDKEMGFAFMTLWEWTGSRWEPVKSGHLSASGVRTGKNNEPWRFSVDKNSIIKLKDMTTDGLYAICIAGTVLT